jgi:hypothetical protein
MRRPLRWLIATVGASLLAFAAMPAAALADGPRPTVESESASNVTETDATLEAQINPGSGEDGFSLATTYEFFLESPWCGSRLPFGACEASGGKLVYKGVLPAGSAPQLVSVDLASVAQTLSPDTTYGYRVVATNEVGEAFGGEQTFTTLPGKAPVIESVSVSHLTATDATLEATIDSEDLKTTYAFQLWSSPCSKKGAGCELIREVKLPSGASLYPSSVPQSVSLDLGSVGVTLGTGEYGFSVTAENEAGHTSAFGGVFEAPEEGAQPEVEVVKPYGSGVMPGPVSNEPEVPLAGGQHSTSGANSTPAPAGSSTSADLSSKPVHGKPSTKHGKRRKHEHRGKHTGKGHKRTKH